jgi:hypothetical protein
MKHLTLRQSSKNRSQGDQRPHFAVRLPELRQHPAATCQQCCSHHVG